MVFGTGPPGIHKQLDDGVLADSRQARDGVDRHSFHHHADDLRAGFCRELVHAPHYDLLCLTVKHKCQLRPTLLLSSLLDGSLTTNVLTFLGDESKPSLIIYSPST